MPRPSGGRPSGGSRPTGGHSNARSVGGHSLGSSGINRPKPSASKPSMSRPSFSAPTSRPTAKPTVRPTSRPVSKPVSRPTRPTYFDIPVSRPATPPPHRAYDDRPIAYEDRPQAYSDRPIEQPIIHESRPIEQPIIHETARSEQGTDERVSEISKPTIVSESEHSRKVINTSSYSEPFTQYSEHTPTRQERKLAQVKEAQIKMMKSSKISPLFWVAVAIAIILLATVIFGAFNPSNTLESTVNRVALTDTEFDSNCYTDEEQWLSSPTVLEKGLKYFHSKTGVSPYVAILSYNESLKTDADKEAYASTLYDEYFDDEYHFLYVYFTEADPNVVGYMCYVSGKQVDSIMDNEAIDIFWANVDKYFYSDLVEDEMFATIFKDTADTIMRKVTTTNDVLKMLSIGTSVAMVILVGFIWWASKAKRDKEKAEETERILNTPIEELGNEKIDDLTDKYK